MGKKYSIYFVIIFFSQFSFAATINEDTRQKELINKAISQTMTYAQFVLEKDFDSAKNNIISIAHVLKMLNVIALLPEGYILRNKLAEYGMFINLSAFPHILEELQNYQ